MQKVEKIGDTRFVSTVITSSPEETKRLGEAIGSRMRGGELIALKGDLGSGKTIFIKGLALGLGIKDKDVSSPTFVFIHEHRGRLTLYHVDLYRIERASDIEDIGLFELIDGETITAIEWADRAGGLLPDDRIDIEFVNFGADNREILLKGSAGAHERILKDGIALFLSGRQV